MLPAVTIEKNCKSHKVVWCEGNELPVRSNILAIINNDIIIVPEMILNYQNAINYDNDFKAKIGLYVQ